MAKELNLRLILSALDKMTPVVRNAYTQTQGYMERVGKANGLMAKQLQTAGLSATATGAALAYSMQKPVAAFMEAEAASTRLATTMMQDGNRMNAHFEKVNALAVELGNKLPGTSADLQNMMTSLLRNGVTAEQILGGMGEATANLAVVLGQGYEETAIFSAKLGKAAGIASQDMMKFLDIIARTRNLGVQTEEMQYAFSKSSSALQRMGLSGLEASKGVAALYASLIQAGASGETVGTGMTSMFSSMVDPKKMKQFNEQLAKVGVGPMKFTDQKGNFAGIENMIAQLDRLKKAGLSSEQLTQVQNALLGPGQDANFFGQLIQNGVAGYNNVVQQMAGQAQMQDRVNKELGTLASKWDAATGTFTNAMASFAAKNADTIKSVVDAIGAVSEAMIKWMEKHPTLTKWIGITVASLGALLIVAGSVALAIGSVISMFGIYATAFAKVASWFGPTGWISKAFAFLPKILSFASNAVMWLGRAFMMVGRMMMANPIILIITAIAVAAFLIYKYWDDIVPFFKKLWDTVSKWFTTAWNNISQTVSAAWQRIKQLVLDGLSGLWDLFTKYHPIGIVIKHWDEIIAYLGTIGGKFLAAGENIMNSLFEGMKNMANKPIEAIKDTVSKMREYLPFSPAKVGPLRDIHRVKIVETIAQAIKPTPMVKAMRTVAVASMAAIAPATMPKAAGAPIVASAPASKPAAASGSNVVINYNPTITVTGATGGTTLDSIKEALRNERRFITELVTKELQRERQKTF